MYSKILSLLAFAAFLLASESRADFSSGDFNYKTNATGASITRYKGSGGDITIPSSINGLSVTSIWAGAFSGCRSLTSISIPNTITSIGDQAFSGCRSLTSISIPNTVTSIGIGAFYECRSLTSIVIPNSVTSIEFWAFFGCSSLTSISIPNDVTSIGAGAFSGCSSLTSISIPNSVTSIGSDAFSGCSSLPASSGFQYVTWGNGIYIAGYTGNGGNVTIPATINGLPVTTIGIGAFIRCSSLTSIVIPDSVSSIGAGAFSGCSSLTSISIPNTVTSIGFSAFWGCSSLPASSGFQYVTWGNGIYIAGYTGNGGNVTIPATINGLPVTTIGDGAFIRCSSLTSIVIPDSVSSIGAGAFSGCSSLTSISIPNSVTSIGSYAFSESRSLAIIVIPNSVTSIGGSAFSGCSSLTSISIPNSVTSIGDQAFSGCSSDLRLLALSDEVWSWLVQNADTIGLNSSQIIRSDIAPQSITFLSMPAVSYGASPFTLVATASSGLTVSFSSSSTNISIAGSIVTVLGTGTATIVASQEGDSSYPAATPLTNTLVVNGPNPSLKIQTISFSSLKVLSWTNVPVTLTAKAKSGLPITYTSSDPNVATVSGGILTPVGVGTATITAYQGGNTIWNPATPVSQKQVITRSAQKITFPPIVNRTYGEGSFTLTASCSSGLPITFSSSATNVATVSSNVVTIVGTGTAKITASQAGNALYTAATSTTQTLNVAKANQTVSFAPITPLTYTNGGLITFTGTASSGLPLTYTSSKSTVISISKGASQGLMKGRGTTTITASQAGNANFNKASATSSITLQ